MITVLSMFVVQKSETDKLFLRFKEGHLTWIEKAGLANTFPSRYSAKRYMNMVHPNEEGWVVVTQ